MRVSTIYLYIEHPLNNMHFIHSYVLTVDGTLVLLQTACVKESGGKGAELPCLARCLAKVPKACSAELPLFGSFSKPVRVIKLLSLIHISMSYKA